MKVAFLAPGISWHTVRWFNALKNEVDLRLFTISPRSDEYRNSQVVLKAPYPKPLSYLFLRSILRKKISAFRPDIVHAHYATGYGYLGARLGIHPYIVSVWGSDIFDFPHKSHIHSFVVKSILKRADAICATSETLKKGVVALYPDFEEKTKVIPFGIDLDIFRPAARYAGDDEIIIGTARNLEKIYQIDLLMKIFDRIAGSNNAVRLRIAGDGPEREHLLMLKDSLRSSDRIEFMGEIGNPELPAFLQNLDIFVISSRFESYGVSALEASACGLPVLGFDVGGLHEIIENGKTGVLVPSGDLQGFERALCDLINDRSLREVMGKAGRQRALAIGNIKMMVRLLLKLYKSLL